MKVSWGCFFAIGNVINVPFSFLFFRGHFLNLDFGLGYEGKLGWCFFFAIENVINVPFSFFSLGDTSWTWISAWILNCKMKRRILFLFRNFCFFFKKWESLNY